VSKFAQLTKPVVGSKVEAALKFAEAATETKQKTVKVGAQVKGSVAPAGYKRLTINLPESLHKKLRLKAIEQNTTATEIIERLLQDRL
jgi:hypothetical protein